MSSLTLTIASPERVLFEGAIQQTTLPTKMGQITILPNHIPLVAALTAGELSFVNDKNETIFLAVSGGAVEISDNHITILSDTAERSDEIDELRAQEAKQRAESLLKEQKTDTVEYASIVSKLEKELARISVVRRRRR